MNACSYCSNHPRFLLFHPADSGGTPRKEACGEHLAMGVDELMFEIRTAEVLVIENQP